MAKSIVTPEVQAELQKLMTHIPEEDNKVIKNYRDYKMIKSSMVIGRKKDGKPKLKYFYAKTKKEMDKKKYEYKMLRDLGLTVSNMTVNEWYEQWLLDFKFDLSEEQLQHYKSILRLHILPEIGDKLIRDVKYSQLRKLLHKYEGGKSGTVKKIHGVIKALFRDAHQEGIITKNPAHNLHMVEVVENTRRALTDIELEALITVCETHKRGVYILIMLLCGLRRGECIALIRSDLDLVNGYISVNKAISHKSGKAKLTKTKANKLRKDDDGHRVVPIPDYLLPILVEYCKNLKPTQLLFPKQDGKMATDCACRRWWSSVKRQCHLVTGAKTKRNAILLETSSFGDEITPHYLRHTYATLLRIAGVDDFTRKILLGHSLDGDVTMRYTHSTEEDLIRAKKLLNEYLDKKLLGKN